MIRDVGRGWRRIASRIREVLYPRRGITQCWFLLHSIYLLLTFTLMVSVLKSHLWYKLTWLGTKDSGKHRGLHPLHSCCQGCSGPRPYFTSCLLKGKLMKVSSFVAVIPWAVEMANLLRKEREDNFILLFFFSLFWGQTVALNSDRGRTHCESQVNLQLNLPPSPSQAVVTPQAALDLSRPLTVRHLAWWGRLDPEKRQEGRVATFETVLFGKIIPFPD